MNRRTFFGFACGGVAAAPLALVGEKATAHPEAVSELLPGADARQVITVSVDGSEGDAYVRQIIQQNVADVMRDFERRQASYNSRRA